MKGRVARRRQGIELGCIVFMFVRVSQNSVNIRFLTCQGRTVGMDGRDGMRGKRDERDERDEREKG